MITNEVEKAKQALTSIYTLEKAEFELMWRWDNDPEYPTSFWRMTYYQDKRCAYERPAQKNWNLLMACDLDKLEEAVAYPIVKTIKNNHYQSTEVPDKLKKHWKPYKIVVEDDVYIRKDRIRTSTHIQFWIQLTTGEWKLDYEEGRNNFASALTYVPGQYYWMHEGGVPFQLSYTSNEDPQDNDIVGFMYKGHYFTNDHFIPSQKCICGKSKTYYNDYDDDNSIKVEVWSVDKFFEKDTAYIIEDNKVFFNGEFYRDPYIKKEAAFLTDKEKNRIKELFPEVKAINTEMEWMNFAK